jgi:cell division protein FtsZ
MVAPGLVNLDFADIRTVMAEMGKAMMGTGEAEGENRAIRAAEAAISNPLLEETNMAGAQGLLINITGGNDMTLFEVDQAANRIREEVSEDANIIFGSAIDDNLEGRIRVSVVATGIDTPVAQVEAPRPRLVAVGNGAPIPLPMATHAPQTMAHAAPISSPNNVVQLEAAIPGPFLAAASETVAEATRVQPAPAYQKGGLFTQQPRQAASAAAPPPPRGGNLFSRMTRRRTQPEPQAERADPVMAQQTQETAQPTAQVRQTGPEAEPTLDTPTFLRRGPHARSTGTDGDPSDVGIPDFLRRQS